MRTLLFATAAALLIFPDAARCQGQERQRIDTTFAFAKGGGVDLALVSGDIIVTGWARNEVKILASIEIGYFETSFSPSRVSINAKSRRNRMGESRIEISVPVGTQVRASSVSGNVRVRGTSGETLVNSVSGDIEVRDASDVVEMHAVSGDVRAENLRGRIQVNTVSGDIRLDDAAGAVRGKTVSGTLVVRGALDGLDFESVSGDFEFRGDFRGTGSFAANTHSGDIRVTLPENLAADLDLQTFSGDLRTEFPLTLQPGQTAGRRGREMRTTINGGGARISLGTFSGDITIQKGASRPTKED
ncbi:MAG TPA: DUF4097 family beta strand repeat-containing protein [Gemmatimonadaceae bacterium]|jgi:DUF4097 and DUF4098 domain-containing protein YvlB